MIKRIKDKRYLKLRYWREVVGLKQDDFAVLLGCKSANYCQKENGKSPFRVSEAFLIRDAINMRIVKNGYPPITVDELFSD